MYFTVNMRRCMFVLLFVIVGVYTQTSTPPITLLGNGLQLHCISVNDSTNSAVTFVRNNYTDELKYDLPENACRAEDDSFGCLTYNKNTQIKKYIQNRGVNGFAGYVFDQRWENFRLIKTIHSSDDFSPVINIHDDNFKFAFSVRIEENGHIHLCDGPDPPTANCYWFILEGWKRSNYVKPKTALRRCSSDIPRSKDKYPRTCQAPVAEKNVTGLTSLSKWSHFRIEVIGDKISLYKFEENDPIIAYTYNGHENFKIRYLTFRSPNINGFWKVHQYDFMEVTGDTTMGTTGLNLPGNLCVTLYLKLCQNCKADIRLKDVSSNDLLDLKAIGDVNIKEGNWTAIQLKHKTVSAGRVEITVTRTYGEKWYLGEMFQCPTDGIRKVTTTYSPDTCCYIIETGMEICNQANVSGSREDNSNTKSQCPPNTIGSDCIPCTLFGNCDKYKYCQFETDNVFKCHCARGFRGGNCKIRCAYQKYGEMCSQTCNRCRGACSPDDGECLSECKSNFEGYYCESVIKPVLKYKPEVVDVGHTNVTLKLSGAYEGRSDPAIFDIQLKQGRQKWISVMSEEFSSGEGKLVTIGNLQKETTYNVRILLKDKYDIVYDEEAFIPTSDFTTTCKELTPERIKVIIEGPTVSFEIRDSEETCDSTYYKIDQGRNYLLPITSKLITFPKCSLTSATIINIKTNLSFNVSLKTGDWETEGIQCPEVVTSATSAILKWDHYRHEPISYKIRYQKHRNLNCNEGYAENWTDYISVYETTVAITALDPYTNYGVEISPTGSNNKQRVIEFNTKSSDTLIGESMSVTWNQKDDQLHVTAEMDDCTQMSGPVDFAIELKCESAWCTKENPQNYYEIDFKRKSFPFNIIGVTNYSVLSTIKRNTSERPYSRSLTTDATQPGPVIEPLIYSKTDNSMFLRWKPPYPPMGKLKQYGIYYNCESFFCTSKGTSYCSPKVCPLYPEYHCCSISQLSSNEEYTLKIYAMNETPEKFGAGTHLSGRTTQEIPEGPAYVELTWDKYHNLTVKFPHPNITNGPLTRYVIYRDSTEVVNNPIDSEKPFYIANISDIGPANMVTVHVLVSNAVGASRYVTNETISPPPVPDVSTIHPTPDITNLTIVIPKFELPNEVTCSLLVFVIDTKSTGISTEEDSIFKRYKIDTDNRSAWIAINKTLQDLDADNWTFVIGADSITSSGLPEIPIRNQMLTPDTVYDIITVITTTFRNVSRTIDYKTTVKTKMGPDSGANFSLFLLILLIVPVICSVCFVVLRMRGIKIAMPMQWRNSEHSSHQSSMALTPVPRQETHQPKQLKPQPVIYQNASEALEMDGHFSRVVKISELEEYVKNALEQGELERQHALFPRGQTKPWIQGMKPENKKKNRYINLAAYDYTRIKLDVINDDPNTDYINANYIDGYNHPKAFIATQGPKEATLDDFWRMIWQENVEHIVMIANLVEGGKKKVAKYWPDINETKKFGEISVKYMSVDIFADYEERVFAVSRNGQQTRRIKQLHFVSWPDHGIPLYPQSLVPFHKKMLAINLSNKPVVVHCSAGVGRTGTFILCDTCLRMAAREGKVDILHQQFRLREQRPNMVDNAEQYKLVHLVLLQCLVAPDTSILCTENMIDKLQSNQYLIASDEIKKQMKYLDDSAWQDDAMKMNTMHGGPAVIVPEKNRSRNILPDESSKVMLSPYPITDESTTYINAINVDGFQAPSKYIITQYPLKNTVGDFWRMILQQDITVVICLNKINTKDHTLGKFYPTEDCPEITPVPFLKVKFVSEDETSHFNTFTFNLVITNQSSSNCKVTLLQLKGWKSENILPDNTDALLSMYEQANRLGKSCDEILICCYDGARASGLFTAMSFVIDKIKLEQVCDVCQAVRSVRHSRNEFVRKEEQFSYLYKCALEYVRKFELYSNFRS